MPSQNTPRIVVLLATCNGARWINAQIDSILAQQGVAIRLVVRDDGSTDTTRSLLEGRAAQDARITLLPASAPSGSAAANFFALLAMLGNLGAPPDAVALADQDDVWLPDKLRHAWVALQTRGVAGVSASVWAWWPDGRKTLLTKSQPLQAADHWFESAGPGCTYVLRGDVAMHLSDWVAAHREALRPIAFHDWWIYAWVRHHGGGWWIDPVPRMHYRQHGSNVLGARAGWRAKTMRLHMLFNGWHRQQALAIAQSCGAGDDPLIVRLQRYGWRDRWALTCQARSLRRKTSDALALACALCLGWQGTP